MKRVILMRHAKAVKDGTDDRVRTLAPRGERTAPAMGRVLALAKLKPEVILSSPAVRARRTAELVAAGCGFEGKIEIVDSIYEGSTSGLISVLQAVREPTGCVLLVGHNPEIERLTWTLCRASPSAVPWAGLRMATGTAVLIEMAADVWDRLEPGSGRIEWSLPPRLALAIQPKLEVRPGR